jgi:hypothetical protein
MLSGVHPVDGGVGMGLFTPCAEIRILTLALFSFEIFSKLALPSALKTSGTSAAREAVNFERFSALEKRHW